MALALFLRAALYQTCLLAVYSHFAIKASVHRHMGSGIPKRHDSTPSCDWNNSNIKIVAVCLVEAWEGWNKPFPSRSSVNSLTYTPLCDNM